MVDSPESQSPEPEQNESIVIPTFSSLRSQLREKAISTYWNDDLIDPNRVFRVSYEKQRGKGASLVMPLSASWMSSGKEVVTPASNTVIFPSAIDRTAVAYMEKTGVLGQHTFIDHFSDFPNVAATLSQQIYNVDDLPDEWDTVSANRADTVRRVNTKKELNNLSSFAAPYSLVDVRSTTVEDFIAAAGEKGVVYVKLNNTESSGDGVIICRSPQEYMDAVKRVRTQAEQYGLDFEIVLQPHVDGENRSFQYFMSPNDPHRLHLIASSRQFVEEDGKTYAASDNFPLTPEAVTPQLSAVMIDMAQKIRAIDPQAFGFVMCDYFHREGQSPLTFDPGLRPTGNTATALARLWAEELDGRTGWHSSLFGLSGKVEPRARSFDEYRKPAESLFGPDALVKEGAAIMPWGYNHFQGRGVMIALGRTRDAMEQILKEAQSRLQPSA